MDKETQAVRMARVEEKIDTLHRDVGEIKECIKEIPKSLELKADKAEVQSLNRRMWAIAAGLIMLLAGAIITLATNSTHVCAALGG